ncbi:hypothetical protein ACFYPH_01880 [Micromonospora sp. NPDC005252]|uniref:hypothetical protein n=1 Tax=unclassified Micromonospora TaxID=2617518 RepID=UPI0033B67AC5
MDASARRLGWYLTLGGLLAVIDTTVTVVALPRLVDDLDTNLTTSAGSPAAMRSPWSR